jgi:uncharacterized protein involved in exopolysaccharide biosynthesis
MSGYTGIPLGIAFRDLLLTVVHGRWRLMLIMVAVMGLAVATAMQIERRYEAKSSLLVLFGPEYSFRPAAGQQMSTGNVVDYEQVLRTEADLIANEDLHRSVILGMGIDRLYPKLLAPPSRFQAMWSEVYAYLESQLGTATTRPRVSNSEQILAQAVRNFAANLTIGVDRKSAIIRLSFIHPNAETAAEVLRELEKQYFAMRGKLFNDLQAPIVEIQRSEVGRQLIAADRMLESFKREHDIANFGERQKILLAQQGRLEDEAKKTDSVIAGLQAKVAELGLQLRAASGSQPGSKAQPNAAAPMQSAIEAYRRRENEALTTYRGSPAVDSTRMEMLKTQSELGKIQSNHAFYTAQELNKAQADLTANVGSRDTTLALLAKTNAEVASVSAEEGMLHQLERRRSGLEDQYRAVAKILDERRVVEAVSDNRQPSVRIAAQPSVPTMPLGTRRLVLLAGVLLAGILGLIGVLLPSFLRGVYLRFEALEMDTGLTVLASLPESKALARHVVLVTPG